MKMILDTSSIEDYRRYLAIKRLPMFRIIGHEAWFPDEYAASLGIASSRPRSVTWTPEEFLFDYQRDIALLAIRKRKFAVFADCGLGKTHIAFEFLKAAQSDLPKRKNILIVSPLMVIRQTLAERERFYPLLEIEQVAAADLHEWLSKPSGRIGITNYDAIREGLPQGTLHGIVLDESSTLKSHYGHWATRLLELGRGVEWKLCLTGTPAPNDRIEYANHAVFLDHFPTVNSFLATYFVNRGQTNERWELKQHALGPFYRALSHWSIFLTNPATYGWKDNCENIPPIRVHIDTVPLTTEQRDVFSRHSGKLFATSAGGITTRGLQDQLAKGRYKGKSVKTNKPEYIRKLIETWDESTIVWCIYNEEQDTLARTLAGAASMSGSTPHDERMRMLDGFLSGDVRTLISKPKILGFGLNLQRCTRQVFSGLKDSYESYYQAVKRSNRYGSTKPLNVHIPVTELEEPMVQNVLRKAKRVQQDTEEQERIFKSHAFNFS